MKRTKFSQLLSTSTTGRRPFCYVTRTGQAVSANVLDGYALKAGEGSRQLPLDRFAVAYGERGLVEPLYNPEALASLLEINTYHYRACKTKARDAAGLGWSLKPTVQEPSEEANQLLDDFFSDLSPPLSITLDRWLFDYEAIGYAALELVRADYAADGLPTLLTHLPAHTVRRHKDGVRIAQIREQKTRWFKLVGHDKDVDCDTGAESALGTLAPDRRATEILWITNYTPRSDYYGLPDVIPAMGAMLGDVSRRDYNIAFFRNFGVPAYAVFITGDFDPGVPGLDGRTDLERQIETHFQELARNPHSTLIMSVPSVLGAEGRKIDIRFERLAVDVREASFRLYRSDNRDEILSAHGVPPYRCGIAETGSLGGSTAVEATEIYKMSVIEPRQVLVEDLINRHIVRGGFEVEDWEFKLAEIDTVDEGRDLAMATGLFAVGAITPNEIIRHFADQFGLTPVDHPAMDAHYIGGKPVELETESEAGAEVEAVMMDLKARLVEVAAKYGAGTADGSGSREVAQIAASFEAGPRLASRR